MPFDGGSDIGAALPLIGPYHYHPDTASTGVLLAYCQAQSFLYCRTHSRLVGYQTRKLTHLTSLANTRAVESTSLVGIAEFRAQLPAHATHIVCTAFYGIVGEHNNFEVHHRVSIFDGTNTDNGTEVVEEHQSGPGSLINADGYTTFDYSGNHSAEFYVARSATLGAATSTVCTITATAFALEADTSNAVPYMPYLIVCRWESL